jgi:hypothetical protein
MASTGFGEPRLDGSRLPRLHQRVTVKDSAADADS